MRYAAPSASYVQGVKDSVDHYLSHPGQWFIARREYEGPW